MTKDKDCLISRQAVLDLWDKYHSSIAINAARYDKELRALLSVEPEIVRCRDCKYFVGEGMYCENDIIVYFDHFYCYYAERRTDE